MRLERSNRFVDVFHGRTSYELGLEIGRHVRVGNETVEQKFHIQDVLSLFAPEVRYRSLTATTREQVARFLDILEAWTGRISNELLRGEDEFFDQLSEQAVRYSTEFLDGVRAERLRSQAADAWRRMDLASVIMAYEEIDSELQTAHLRASEIERLRYARTHVDR